MEKKFTKRMALETMLSLSEVRADERLVAYCENELRLLDNKNKVDRKPTWFSGISFTGLQGTPLLI